MVDKRHKGSKQQETVEAPAAAAVAARLPIPLTPSRIHLLIGAAHTLGGAFLISVSHCYSQHHTLSKHSHSVIHSPFNSLPIPLTGFVETSSRNNRIISAERKVLCTKYSIPRFSIFHTMSKKQS